MSGKRILDAIALFKASRNIAINHFSIRLSQVELYRKTSSIVRLLKPLSSSISRFSQSTNVSAKSNINPQAQENTGPTVQSSNQPGVNQDHFYKRDENNSPSEPPSTESIGIEQSKAKRYPFPDGTIPPVNTKIGQEAGDPETENKRSTESGQHPLINKNDFHPTSSFKSTIPTPTDRPLSSREARIAQRQSEDQIPAKPAEPPGDEPEFSIEQEKDVFYQPPNSAKPVLSALPRVKVPKIENDVQGGDSHIPKELNADVFYSGSDGNSSEPTEEQLSQIFHNPRLAKLLGKKNARPFSTYTKRYQDDQAAKVESKPYEMRESRVPSSRMGRLFEYGGLAASMAFGAVGESISGNKGSLMLNPSNMERLVKKLSKMRGAALKLGQMISFQDMKMLPQPIIEVLQRVQDSADYMPASQRNQVIENDLGPNWRDLFQSFEEKPMAAASIGQVHGAILKSGLPVAVKIQYPGVATSISSDLNNLALLLTASRLLPKGLYLEKTIANARTELAWECDYIREANAAKRFKELLQDEPDIFKVPKIIDEASGKQVLTMERMEGIAVTKIKNFSQEQKNWIGTQILRLCFREIIEFKYMQTDPNWTNFLYNNVTNKLELLDFGASRDYPERFIKLYSGVLEAASKNDRQTCQDLSIELGYLTGYESKAMLNAHIDSVMTLAEPFNESAPDIYDFKDQTITDRVRSFIPIMLRERLAPPPEETYSLHRKLSGAFLLCARLGSQIRCKELFRDAMKKAN